MKLSDKFTHYAEMADDIGARENAKTWRSAAYEAFKHEQLQGRRATETWRNPGWEEREKESKT